MKVRYLGKSNPLRFLQGKVYEVIGEEDGRYRIIDETGEDYLYTLKNFEKVESKSDSRILIYSR